MQEFINYLFFGWYPYVALTFLFLGSILRFDKGQYTWRSQSSQFLRRRQMILGSNLFHIGVIVLFIGHFVGLLTPITVFEFFGISPTFKQLTALIVGGLAGISALVGATLLLHRRLFDPRIRRSSSIGDILVLVLLWLQLVLGIATTYWTIHDLSGEHMVLFMGWAHGILTFNPSAADLIVDAYFVYKIHIVLGLTLFLITPFTRLVHIWSVPIWYLLRPGYQIVRTRAKNRGSTTPVHSPAGLAPTPGGDAVARAQSESGQ